MYHIYQIASNDTISEIAHNFHTTEDEIKKINGIYGDVTLRPGGFIIVPSNQNKYLKTYIVKKGDNMYAIAREEEVDYKILLDLNGLDEQDYIYPGQEIFIPNKNIKIYKTKEGDNIHSLEQLTGQNIQNIITPSGEIYIQKDQIIMY